MNENTSVFMTTTVTKNLFPMMHEPTIILKEVNPPIYRSMPTETSFIVTEKQKQQEYFQRQVDLLERESRNSKRSITPATNKQHYLPSIMKYENKNRITNLIDIKKCDSIDNMLVKSNKKTNHNYFRFNKFEINYKTPTPRISAKLDKLPATPWMSCSNSSLSMGIIGKSVLSSSSKFYKSN